MQEDNQNNSNNLSVGTYDRGPALKQALVENLTAILSPDHDQRIGGEKNLKFLEATEEYGVMLAELVIDPSGPLAIRQLSSIVLKQYVEAHWTSVSEKFVGPEATDKAKNAIRELIVNGLSESISKIRSSVAYVISTIASWDWPEAWPDLFGILMRALTSGNHDYTHGATRVLLEFSREITGAQVHHIAPVLFPELCKILQMSQDFSVRTRSRAVCIIFNCVSIIAEENGTSPGTAKALLFPILPNFLELFMAYLRHQDPLVSDNGLKMEIVKTLTLLIRSFPNHMTKCIQPILEAVWFSLTTVAESYVQMAIGGFEDLEEPVDSDCKVIGCGSFIESLFDFIHILLETSTLKSKVKKASEQMFHYLIIFMQITEEQIHKWMRNPNHFVEDEEEESLMYSVRVSAKDLLMTIFATFPKCCITSLHCATQKQIRNAEAMKMANDEKWWKLMEATLLAIGTACQCISNAKVEGNQQQVFDVRGLLENVILPIMSQDAPPLLIGRAIWLASRFSSFMDILLLEKFMQATVASIKPNQDTCLRICGVRSVCEYCRQFKTSPATLRPFIRELVDGVVAIATQFSSEILNLCLESLAVILEVDPQFTAAVEADVCNLVIALFLKHSSDPIVVSLSQDIFTILAKNELCILPLLRRLTPTLLTILQSPVDKIPYGMQSVSLDVLTVLVRRSPRPLEEFLIQQAFPAAFKCTLETDDNSTLQSGGECLRAFVSVALDQIQAWRDGEGCNGVFYVVKVIEKLLDPKTSEFTATYVGRLISVLISKMGPHLGSDLNFILKCILCKLYQAETLTVTQSLVLVFAKLAETQMAPMIDFLWSVPSPFGESALQFVLGQWCSKQHLFFGDYDRKISSLALCKLVEYTISSNDQRLQNINVPGDLIIDKGGIKTRSKAAKDPHKWTIIPVLVKMYKLIVNELSNQIEHSLSKLEKDGEEDDEDNDDEFEDDEEDFADEGGMEDDDNVASSANFLDDLQDYETDGEDKFDDPDAENDPVSKMDLQAYLTEFIQMLSRQPCYSLFSEHHNESERKVLSVIGISA